MPGTASYPGTSKASTTSCRRRPYTFDSVEQISRLVELPAEPRQSGQPALPDQQLDRDDPPRSEAAGPDQFLPDAARPRPAVHEAAWHEAEHHRRRLLQRGRLLGVANTLNGVAADAHADGADDAVSAAPVARRFSRSSPARRRSCPSGDGWAYEPKYDGFRALVVPRRRRPLRPVARRQAARPLLPGARLPARRLRARRRARDPRRRRRRGLRRAPEPDPSGRVADQPPRRARRPARFRAFDLLALDGESLMERPFAERRSALVELVSGFAGAGGGGPGRLDRRLDRADPADPRPRRGGTVAGGRGGRDRQAARRALRARQADGDGQDQAPAHDRRGRRRLAARQGAGHRRLADARPLRRRRAPRRRPHLRAQGRREARAGQDPRALRDRRPRLRRPEPLGRRPRPRVGLAATRARHRGQLRPRQRRPDPPRRQDPPLARGQGPAACTIDQLDQ